VVIGSRLPVCQNPKKETKVGPPSTIKEFNRFSTPDRGQCPSLPLESS
jgi:hypothetical protein